MPRGAKPKQYPATLVANVTQLYRSGLTQTEISKAVGISQKVIWNLMRRHGIEARVAKARHPMSGPTHPSWRGNIAGKQAFHRRLYAQFGKPKHCAKCGTTEARHYDYANLSGRYEDIDDYMPMCRSCHWKYDDKISNITKNRRDANESA